jgi:RPA family protein
MTKDELIALVREYGDATITYRSQESRKVKYNVCTLDFDNEYIQKKQNRAKESEDTLLLFCWDIDAYRLLKVGNVTSVRPLAESLREGANVR